MSKTVAQSASRALELLISKHKSFGGMHFEYFTQCYNATVQAIIDYSAAKNFDDSLLAKKTFSIIPRSL